MSEQGAGPAWGRGVPEEAGPGGVGGGASRRRENHSLGRREMGPAQRGGARRRERRGRQAQGGTLIKQAGGGAGAEEWGGACGAGGSLRPGRRGQARAGTVPQWAGEKVRSTEWSGAGPAGVGGVGADSEDPPATWFCPRWRWPEALGSLCSRSSGGVCAMGDAERPEASRPQQEEVNIAAASSPAPSHDWPLDCGLRRGPARCRSAVRNFIHCLLKPGVGPASSRRCRRVSSFRAPGRQSPGRGEERAGFLLHCSVPGLPKGNALRLQTGARRTPPPILPCSGALAGEIEARAEDWWLC